MNTNITFFPVGNGDMTLIRLNDQDKTSILIDCCIAKNGGPDCDVHKELLDRLPKTNQGRPYVDAFILSHPDKDHCLGFEEYFHLDPESEYDDDGDVKKIIIGELWSSPVVFRRKSKKNTLSADAVKFRDEAKRRLEVYRDNKRKGGRNVFGDRIRLVGKDPREDGTDKNSDVEEIEINIGDVVSEVNGKTRRCFETRIFAPLNKDEVSDESVLVKNNSSIVQAIKLKPSDNSSSETVYLTAGDTGVDIWEALKDKHKNEMSLFDYDIYLASHHCSWHSIGHGSWSKKTHERSAKAISCVEGMNGAGFIVSSSNEVKDDDNDPPCIEAKREYMKIVRRNDGDFYCIGEIPSTEKPEPFEILITESGHVRGGNSGKKSKDGASSKAAAIPIGHGRN